MFKVASLLVLVVAALSLTGPAAAAAADIKPCAQGLVAGKMCYREADGTTGTLNLQFSMLDLESPLSKLNFCVGKLTAAVLANNPAAVLEVVQCDSRDDQTFTGDSNGNPIGGLVFTSLLAAWWCNGTFMFMADNPVSPSPPDARPIRHHRRSNPRNRRSTGLPPPTQLALYDLDLDLTTKTRLRVAEYGAPCFTGTMDTAGALVHRAGSSQTGAGSFSPVPARELGVEEGRERRSSSRIDMRRVCFIAGTRWGRDPPRRGSALLPPHSPSFDVPPLAPSDTLITFRIDTSARRVHENTPRAWPHRYIALQVLRALPGNGAALPAQNPRTGSDASSFGAAAAVSALGAGTGAGVVTGHVSATTGGWEAKHATGDEILPRLSDAARR
ncbi:hypothetical protein DFH06DRAFT_1339311 [Mycena polygramma]|nr:hypothetical protein DFH06DRAFT_1339311 [Mycena polygramma]